MKKRGVTLDLTKFANGKPLAEFNMKVIGCECIIDDLAMLLEAQSHDIVNDQAGRQLRTKKPCGCGGEISRSTA